MTNKARKRIDEYRNKLASEMAHYQYTRPMRAPDYYDRAVENVSRSLFGDRSFTDMSKEAESIIQNKDLQGKDADTQKFVELGIDFMQTSPGGALTAIGRQGAKAGERNLLKLAQHLKSLGKIPDKEITRATGWYLDDDHAWKMLIPDNKAKVLQNLQEIKDDLAVTNIIDELPGDFSKVKGARRSYYGQLSQFVKHDELFSRYPELAKARVQLIYDPKYTWKGQFDPVKETQTINLFHTPQYKKGTNYLDVDFLSTMLHETQHSIQKMEKFARGSSQTEFRQWADELVYDAEQRLKELDRVDSTVGLSKTLQKEKNTIKENLDIIKNFREQDDQKAFADWAFKQYLKTHGEVEARNTQMYRFFDRKKLAEIGDPRLDKYSEFSRYPKRIIKRYNNYE